MKRVLLSIAFLGLLSCTTSTAEYGPEKPANPIVEVPQHPIEENPITPDNPIGDVPSDPY
ncbi:hypothetical protein [Flammeovirga kamogawensis]|uniref:Lipoprotein n=1 Tax=Flammeovirga kamogawensis TaxID=373891 RepID=A0ABX8GXB3_9BACT|nr:hypothetical protein [Flammeovirga kamogawensis]MBB6460705.1 hypothetical protein [Flammeovirga kamogawensis]QWG08059.1 hypothetical protein KM029_03740 [Flammeovirga kamogawensis]TRX69865.1 hypothetical protein EO216_17680 [Flammeovirga kamogawensis]